MIKIPAASGRDILEEPKLRFLVKQAGFPSPEDDHLDKALNLNEYLVSNPASTFFVKAKGDSMKDAGIQSGDILVVDRSVTGILTGMVARSGLPTWN
jgi:phage repressor protein C with HTH and peptisase S24 domain